MKKYELEELLQPVKSFVVELFTETKNKYDISEGWRKADQRSSIDQELAKIERKLKKPFPKEDIEWRISRSGIGKRGPWAIVLAYITARAVMDRLDDVVGPGNWKVSYDVVNGGFLCHLSIRVGEEWITKSDGADATDVEQFKGGISSALKRAAVVWGIGRYLYDLGDTWAVFTDKSDTSRQVTIKDNNGAAIPYNWDIDWSKFPAWALPPEKETNKIVEKKSNEGLSALKDKLVSKANTERASPESAPVTRAEPQEAGAATPKPNQQSTTFSKPAVAAVLAKVKVQKDPFVIAKDQIQGATSMQELKAAFEMNLPYIMEMPETEQDQLIALKDLKKKELSSGF